MGEALASLCNEIAACRVCAAHLPAGPRPVVQLGATARLLIIGQAPGSKVHASGIPWEDASGARLQAWLGIDAATFYDANQIAMMPMGFCYPGAVSGAGDLPPRPECAPLWHERVRAALPDIHLTILIGQYAQQRYLASARRTTLTETVRAAADFLPSFMPLPHPSWRSTGWMRRNPWFEAEILPTLQTAVAHALCG